MRERRPTIAERTWVDWLILAAGTVCIVGAIVGACAGTVTW